MPEVKKRPTVPDIKLKRPVRLGVNPLDLAHLDPGVLVMVLKGRVDLSPKLAVLVDKNRQDERCSVFNCDLLGAALALDILRNEARHSDSLCRAYINRGESWVRLPAAAVLCRKDGAGYTLDLKWFPVVEEAGLLVAPPPERVLSRKRT